MFGGLRFFVFCFFFKVDVFSLVSKFGLKRKRPEMCPELNILRRN